jgi:hypothetical protein
MTRYDFGNRLSGRFGPPVSDIADITEVFFDRCQITGANPIRRYERLRERVAG